MRKIARVDEPEDENLGELEAAYREMRPRDDDPDPPECADAGANWIYNTNTRWLTNGFGTNG